MKESYSTISSNGNGLTSKRISVSLLLVILAVSICVPVISFATFASSATSQSSSVLLAPVYIKFNPNKITVAPGGVVNTVATATNKGSLIAIATSCTLWYKIAGSLKWIKANSCLKKSDFPFTIQPGQTASKSISQPVSTNFPAGTVSWKIVFHGTYGGVSAKSHPGYFTVIIT